MAPRHAAYRSAARSCCRRICACAGRRPARDQAAVSAEYRIGRRHVLGRGGVARPARVDRTGRGQPLVAGRQPRPIDPAPARGPDHGRRHCWRGCGRTLRRGGAGCSISRRISVCPALRRSPARRMALALPSASPRGRHSQAAARAAVLEMCQVELAYAVVEAKCRERGEAALNERDRVHRRRATMINADRCPSAAAGARSHAEHLAIDTTDANAVLRADRPDVWSNSASRPLAST